MDSSATSFFIPEERIKGKSGQLIITQETSGKRVSKKVSLDIVKKGEVEVVNY